LNRQGRVLNLLRSARNLVRRCIIAPADHLTSAILDKSRPGPPPTIVQYWDRNAPPEVVRWMQTWERGPCARWFAYRCFDDDSALRFLEENYDARVVSAWRQCGVAAMKADFLRYCFLYRYAGLWADADLGCLRNLYPLYRHLDRGLLFSAPGRSPDGMRLVNWFLAVTRPEDPLLKLVIERCLHNIENRIGNNVHTVTGGGLLTALHRSPDALIRSLFEGYKIIPAVSLRTAMTRAGGLEYKATEAHWTIAQRHGSIFANAGNDSD
jgi:mannosyltransferase OCH1-like enzyme